MVADFGQEVLEAFRDNPVQDHLFWLLTLVRDCFALGETLGFATGAVFDENDHHAQTDERTACQGANGIASVVCGLTILRYRHMKLAIAIESVY
jgi:hypothetical protein